MKSTLRSAGIKGSLGLLLLAAATRANAQTADIRVGELLNGSDWFALEKEYPALRDSIRTPVLALMSEALLGYYFNRPDRATTSVDSMLRHHQAALGLGNITSMLLVRSSVESRRGNYALAADMLKDFASQLRAQGVETDYSQVDRAIRFYDCFRDCPPMSVKLPRGNAVIAMTNDPVQLKIENDTLPRGTAIHVTVTVGGKPYRAIFDTGAGSTFLSAAFAEKIGVKEVADSLPMQGGRLVYARAGLLDSIRIGDITLENIPVTINPDTTLNRVAEIDFLIGADVMALLGEVQIFPRDGKIVVPEHPTARPAGGSNMYLDNRPVIQGRSGNGTYAFLLDTGNGTAALSPDFYERNREEIAGKARRERRLTGGVGVVEERDVLILPAWRFSFGGREVELRELGVSLDRSSLVPYAGNMGMALVNRFDKVTVNFDDCFVIFE